MPQRSCPDTRWSWVEVDKGALRQNARTLKALLEPGVKMMAVVKADAYGHGAVECARALAGAGADQFAVATVDEGVELREAGIDRPILVLAEPPVTAVETLVEHKIMPSVYTTDFALAYGECAAAHDTVGKYHLALDTGMCRIGVDWQDAVEFRRAIDFHRGLSCAGTFTHFATADVPGDWDFELQYKHFCEATHSLKDAGLPCGLVHCDNTPATILHPETHMDMCREGIALYGLHPAASTYDRIDLEPVMSVRSRVTRAIMPPVGTGVGYGLTYRVPKNSIQICTCSVGYADGLSRTLSGRMDVLVNGMRCRQVGNICMDQFMFALDVNPIRPLNPATPVSEGDVVTIIGRDGDDVITADDHAMLRGTINYEVVCDFGLRLEKIYV